MLSSFIDLVLIKTESTTIAQLSIYFIIMKDLYEDSVKKKKIFREDHRHVLGLVQRCVVNL